MNAAADLRWGVFLGMCAMLEVLACSTQTDLAGPPVLDVRNGEQSVEGELNGLNDRREYHFHGKSGQLVTIRVECPGAVRLQVTAPSGTSDGAPGGIIADLLLGETGMYRVLLTESPMSEGWNGKFHMTISLRQAP